MKAHQPITVIALSCLLLLLPACGKKSVHGVSGVEDFLSGEDQVTGHDEDLYGGSPGQFEELSWGDGGGDGTVEALSTADLDGETGWLGLAGSGQKGSASRSPLSTRNGLPGSSKGAFGTKANNAMARVVNRGPLTAVGGSSDASASRENAWKNGAQFSKALRDVFFSYDSWQLSEQSHRILESNASWLKAHPHARITIEGHCDERGTQAYNYVLGERRAETAKRYLLHLGVPSYQVVVASYGKDRPVCHVFNATCFRSNRRAHFSIDVKTASRD